MGSTNLTPNYELSQFIGTDKPAWLQDYNGDMLKIDTGIAGAKTAADNAQSAADGAQGDATTALSDIANINTELGTVENTLSTATGNINTINSLIGNGTPTTTDQTIIGAINEINAEVTEIDAEVVNISSGYRIISPNAAYSLTTDGVKTVKELLEDIASGFLTNIVANLTNNQRVLIRGISGFQIVGTAGVNTVATLMSNATTTFNVPFYSCGYDGTDLVEYINSVADSASHSAKRENGTVTSRDASVPSTGLKYNIIYDLIEKG